MAPVVPSVALNTGARLPLFGLGTWAVTNHDEFRVALRGALDAGYRLIDTAEIYGNEHVIGEVLEEYFTAGKLKREDVFITTKLPFYAMAPADVGACIKKQLAALRVDYIDLYLVHCPCPLKMSGVGMRNVQASKFEPLDVPHIDTWRAMEKYYRSGHLKALGLSNFNAAQIQALYDLAEIKPANLQVELHIYWPQHELAALCSKLGMTVTGYAPIGSPGRTTFRPDDNWPIGSPMEDDAVVALAKQYGKSPAQILLRHLVQRGISVIPKSTNSARVKQNIDIFDFELSAADQQKLLDVKTRVRLFEFRFCEGSKFFPFEDVNFAQKGHDDDNGI